jgi:ABC-type multidrug transport system fused ATPase/permease subunit
MLGSLVVFATSMFALWAGVSDGYAALVFVQAQSFADATRQLVRVAAQLELDFNSVERIVEYLDVPQEKPAIIANSRPPAAWPTSNGAIVFEDLVVRYAPELPAVLKGLSFTINPSEKIGVVCSRSISNLSISNRIAGGTNRKW